MRAVSSLMHAVLQGWYPDAGYPVDYSNTTDVFRGGAAAFNETVSQAPVILLVFLGRIYVPPPLPGIIDLDPASAHLSVTSQLTSSLLFRKLSIVGTRRRDDYWSRARLRSGAIGGYGN
jgi:hypothetical protein